MNNLRGWVLLFVLLGALGAPASVSAQKNPLKIMQKADAKALKALEKQASKQLRRYNKAAYGVSRVKVGRIFRTQIYKSAYSFSVPGGSLPSVSVAVPVSFLSQTTVPFPGRNRVDAVIFDLDGTLLDSLSAWEHSGTNFLRSQGITPPEGMDDILVKMSLMDGARLIKEQFSLPQTPEEILRLTLEPVRRHYFEDIAAKPGVPETLARLKQEGVKLCVATASDRELAEAALERLGLLDLFDFIVTCDEVGVGKRSAAVYEEALRRLGTEKSRTLVAEDARYALETAKNAGFPTAGVADSHTPAPDDAAIRAQADYYVEHFLDGVFKK